jgi:hypothetical protein
MLACLDNLPQRHRSVTLRTAAPDVDFRTSIRCERIPGRHDPCSRNSPSHACHAKPPAIGISLAEIAGIRSWQRPARAGPRDWHNASGNCGTPRHGPPARYRDRIEGRAERSERSETHFSGPYRGTQVFLSSNGTCSERVDDDALIPRLEGELRAGADAGRPARGHGLELGIEAHAFHAVDAVRRAASSPTRTRRCRAWRRCDGWGRADRLGLKRRVTLAEVHSGAASHREGHDQQEPPATPF